MSNLRWDEALAMVGREDHVYQGHNTWLDPDR